MVGLLRHGQPAVRREGRRGRRQGRHRLGARLPAAAGAADAARPATRPADRLLPAHPVPAGRALPAAALAPAGPRGPPRGRPGRLPARRRRRRTSSGWCASGSGTRPTATWSTCPTAGRVRAAAFPISIDAADFEELARSEGVEQRAPGDPRGAGEPRKVFLGIDRLDYTKGIYARLRAYGELLDEGALRRRGRGLRPGRHAVARAGRAVPHPARRDRPAGGADQRRPGPDRTSGDLLHALLLPARGDGGALPGRRHHGRHAVPRRDEPGRQGVHRLPVRRRRRPGALGVRRRGRRAAAGLAGQPLRHQRHEGRAARRLQRRREGARPPDEGDAQDGGRARREGLGGHVPRGAPVGARRPRQDAAAGPGR